MIWQIVLKLVSLVLIVMSLMVLQIVFETSNNTVFAKEETCGISDWNGEAVDQINFYRSRENLKNYQHDHILSLLACSHAVWLDTNQALSHQGKGGLTPSERCQKIGYKCLGENLAIVERVASFERIVKMWEGSVEHQKNLVKDYERVGVARYRDVVVALFW